MNEQTQTVGETLPPLTDWKNAPTVRDLKQDLEEATPIHQAQVQKLNRWRDNLTCTGTAEVKTPQGNSKIQPKLIRKQAEWRYPALSEPFLSTSDIFKVKPVTWEDRDAARQNQLVLNHQFNTKVGKQKFIDEYVRAAVDDGTVIVMTGWCFEEEEYQEEVGDFEFRVDPTATELLQQVALLRQESPSQYATDVPDELKQALELTEENGVPVRPVQIGTKWVTKTRVVKNHPTVEVLDPRNVVIDPTAEGDLERAGFAIRTFESNLATLRKDKRYKNLDKINVTQANPLSVPDHQASTGVSQFNFNDEPRKKFVVHEYWGLWDIDGTGKVKPFVAAWVNDVMIRLEENPYPDKKIPIVVEHYLPVRKNNHGEPDGHLLEDNQRIIGAVTRGMVDVLAKSANGQTGMRKDMLDATNRRKYERGLDYEFNQNVDPRQGIHMHTFPEIPQSAQFMLLQQSQEAESMTGVKAFSQGISGAALGDVAAGVRGALDAASKRELGILRRLKNGVINIGRKFLAMNAEFLSDEEVIRVTNEQFVTVRRDDLAGNFDLELTISTAEEDNNKAQELAFMLQTMGNNMDPGMSRMLLADIARLRKMPDLAHRIEAYQPQPDPLEQRKRLLEIELLEAQVANERAQGNQRNAAANLAGAKSETEVVKKDHIKADTDLKNLEFVEQESGVHQERELQKIDRQTQNQAGMKSLDHAFDRETQQRDLLKEYVKGTQSAVAA